MGSSWTEFVEDRVECVGSVVKKLLREAIGGVYERKPVGELQQAKILRVA